MTGTQRHNILTLLPKVRSKPKAERLRIYQAMRLGIFWYPMFLAAEITATHQGSPT